MRKKGINKTELLDAIRKFYGFDKKIELAKHLGISPNTLTNWYQRNTVDYDLIIEKCPEINLHNIINHVISGEETTNEPPGEYKPENRNFIKLITEKDKQIVALSEKIGRLKEKIEQMRGLLNDQ